ncbi:MAG: DUF3999 domain-containing protein [Gammaproteobacteria bacterium]|nr:DUF3999 domain-containing protein [Gammaproteobacteria bacterium]
MPDWRDPRPVLLALLSMAGLPAAAATPEPLPPAAYAWGWPIETEATAGYYALALPLEVYRSALDPQLRDVAVFDAGGEPVPRWIGAPEAPQPPPAARSTRIVVPVHAAPGTAVTTLQLALEHRGQQTTVRIDGRSPPAPGPLAIVAGLVDLGEERRDLVAVELEWPAAVEPVILVVHVEGSVDLQQWTALGSGTIAGLREGEASIVQRRIGLDARPVRYLRLHWPSAPAGWSVPRLVAHFVPQRPEPTRESLALEPTGVDPDDQGWLYDAGAAPPVDRLELELPGEQALLRASIFARLPGAERWQHVRDGLFYRLRRGDAVVTSEPLSLPPLRAAQWKVVASGGRSEPGPSLRLGWQADRLLFVAQGAAPWQLAAGSAREGESGFPYARRFADPGLPRLLDRAGPATGASLGPRRELGGPRQLVPRRSPAWRRWLLWLALIAGVAVVAGMAWQLLRQDARDSRPG